MSELKCDVCGKETGTSAAMTDGRRHGVVCDDCRPLVKIMFAVHARLDVAMREARQALTGQR